MTQANPSGSESRAPVICNAVVCSCYSLVHVRTCVCDSDLQHHCCQSPARLRASIFAPLMRMLETCTHSASRCIYIHIGYLLVLVPFTITKCVVCCWHTPVTVRQ